MDSVRTKKVTREIQRVLSEIFREKTQELGGVLITVTEVRLTPDMSTARAFLSIFPEDKQEQLMEVINETKSDIRYDLGNRMKDQLRRIPELIFTLDESEERAANIDRLLGL